MTTQTDARELLLQKIQEAAGAIEHLGTEKASSTLRNLAEAYSLISDTEEKQIPAKRRSSVTS